MAKEYAHKLCYTRNTVKKEHSTNYSNSTITLKAVSCMVILKVCVDRIQNTVISEVRFVA